MHSLSALVAVCLLLGAEAQLAQQKSAANAGTTNLAGLKLPGTTLPGTTLPGGIKLPIGTTLPGGIKLPIGTTLPGGIKLPIGTTLPGGIKLPIGTTLPGATTLPTGTTLPGATTKPGSTTLPGTTQTTGTGSPNTGTTGGQASANIGTFRINKGTVSVSGISSGGAMAVQLHVALSNTIKRSGIIAGLPYACANSQSAMQCMSQGGSISASTLVGTAKANEGKGIDSLGNLKTSLVYMQGGTADTVVSPATMAKVKETFRGLGVPEQSILYDSSIPSQHSWVTDNYGSSCSTLGSPYINNCGVDTTGAMLRHLLNISNPRKPANTTRLFKISQKQFVPNDLPSAVSMDDNAFLYVPNFCKENLCHLHVSLHGCAQGASQIGNTFVSHISLLEYAEANGIVVVFPQAIASYYKPSNPQGCWDWFGYNSKSFYTKDAPQISAIAKMIAFLTK